MKLTVSANDSVSDVLSETEAALNGVAEDIIHECQIIIDEFMANMKHHVFPATPATEWTLELEKTQTGVTIKFRYAGEKFDPASACGYVADCPIERRNIGGLGLILIYSLSDDQHFNYLNGMNEWTIKKHF